MKSKGKVKPLIDEKLISALSHPLRIYILEALSDTLASPSDLAREIGIDVNYVAYHVKELRKIGYVELVKTEPRRGAVEHYYRAKPTFMFDDSEWKRVPKAIKQALNAEIFQLILNEVTEAVEEGTFGPGENHMSRIRFRADEKAWKDAHGILTDALGRILEIQAESEQRLAAEDEEGTFLSISIVSFETAAKSVAERPPHASGASTG